MYRQARQQILERKNKAKVRFDEHVKTRKGEFKTGDLVWLRDNQIKNKLRPKYLGPYRIVAKHHNNSVTLQTDNNKTSTVNLDRLKSYTDRNENVRLSN